MDKEELKKIIVEELKTVYTDSAETTADNIISKILPDGMLIKIIDKEQEFWD